MGKDYCWEMLHKTTIFIHTPEIGETISYKQGLSTLEDAYIVRMTKDNNFIQVIVVSVSHMKFNADKLLITKSLLVK